MSSERRRGILERGANLFEKIHVALGAIALTGAVVLNSVALTAFAVYEFGHGAVWNFLKKRVQKKPKLAHTAT